MSSKRPGEIGYFDSVAAAVKVRANQAHERAVKRGDLPRPSRCAKCDSTTGRIIAHHEDYSRPLDVVHLCQQCHRKAHMENGQFVSRKEAKRLGVPFMHDGAFICRPRKRIEKIIGGK